MDKRILTAISLILLFCSYGTAHSKDEKIKLNGYIVDNNLNRVPGARILLINKADSSVMSSAISEENGVYKISASMTGPAMLSVSHISYKTEFVDIPVACDSMMVICMNEESYSVGDVTVSGTAKTIRIKDDGNMLITLENIKGYNIQSLSEILRKLPGVSVTPGGGIILFGQAATVQMDGKNTKVDVNSLLKTLKAASLSEIELISNPTAEYDASSKAIINLVTRRRKENGHSTSVELSGQMNRDAKFDASANLFTMIKINKFYINNSLRYDAYPYNSLNRGTALYKNTGKTLNTVDSSWMRSRRIMDNLNLAWVLKHNQEISANAFVFYGQENRNSETVQHFSGEPEKKYYSHDKPNNFLVSGNLEYKTGDNVPFMMKASYGFVHGTTKIKENMNVTESGQDILKFLHKTNSISTQHIAKFDYFQRFCNDKLFFGAGAQGEINFLNDNNDYEILSGDSDLSNNGLDGSEKIFGIYAGLTYRPNNTLTLYIGGRAEYTDYELDTAESEETSRNKYWNVLPFASVTYRPSHIYTGTLILSTNINRPFYDYMLPGIYYINEYEYEKGNPNLLPRVEYDLSLKNNFLDIIYFNISGIYGKNTITRILTEKENGITEYTYDNSVDRREIAGWLGFPFSLFKDALSGQINVNGRYGKYFNPRNGFNLLKERVNYYNAGLSAYLDYEITPRLSINAYADYMIVSKTLQSDTKGYAALDLGIQYSFLKDGNLVLSFSANDVFNSRKIISTVYYDNIVKNNSLRDASQSFILSISYRFNGGQKISRREAYDPNNTSRFFGE